MDQRLDRFLREIAAAATERTSDDYYRKVGMAAFQLRQTVPQEDLPVMILSLIQPS